MQNYSSSKVYLDVHRQCYFSQLGLQTEDQTVHNHVTCFITHAVLGKGTTYCVVLWFWRSVSLQTLEKQTSAAPSAAYLSCGESM